MHNKLGGERNMAMRIRCNRCGNTATIQSSSQPGPEVKQLYCCCNNPECGHTFVMEVTFSHTLSPSAMDLPQEVRDRIQASTTMEQRELFKGLLPPMKKAG